MKKLLLLFSILILVSCQDTPEYVTGEVKSVKGTIYYFKDERVNQCYSLLSSPNTGGFTCVPCTEEVEKWIEEHGERIEE